jgi:hypothetical protein
MKIKTCALAILFALSNTLHLSGCEEMATSTKDATATDALLMAKASSTSSAISALNSLDKGEVKVARSTLEAQVVSGLTVLRAMQSEKTSVSAEMIDEAISEAEDYLKRHNLSAPTPTAKD